MHEILASNVEKEPKAADKAVQPDKRPKTNVGPPPPHQKSRIALNNGRKAGKKKKKKTANFSKKSSA